MRHPKGLRLSWEGASCRFLFSLAQPALHKIVALPSGLGGAEAPQWADQAPTVRLEHKEVGATRAALSPAGPQGAPAPCRADLLAWHVENTAGEPVQMVLCV